MATAVVNLTIEQGEDFSAFFTVLNTDDTTAPLSNHTVVGTLKRHPGATTGYSFTTTLTVATGSIKIALGNAITKTLTPGRYYYDVFIVSNSTNARTKVFEGNAIVNPSATLPT